MPSLFVTLEREIRGLDPYVNGSALSDAEDQLTRIAEQLNVQPLMNFFGQDADEAAALLEDFQVDVKDVDLPTASWFDASEGARTVEALLNHVQEHPTEIPNHTNVINELMQWLSVLRHAIKEDVKWRLGVDF